MVGPFDLTRTQHGRVTDMYGDGDALGGYLVRDGEASDARGNTEKIVAILDVHEVKPRLSALTAPEAREMARRLLKAADTIDPPSPLDHPKLYDFPLRGGPLDGAVLRHDGQGMPTDVAFALVATPEDGSLYTHVRYRAEPNHRRDGAAIEYVYREAGAR